MAQNDVATTTRLQKQGLSFMGARQVLSGQIVTSQTDRAVLAKMIADGGSSESTPVARYHLENAWPSG